MARYYRASRTDNVPVSLSWYVACRYPMQAPLSPARNKRASHHPALKLSLTCSRIGPHPKEAILADFLRPYKIWTG